MTYKKNRNKISKEKQKAISQNGGIIMLVTTKEMFKKAYEGHYAIGAFNINNMEIVQAVTEAAAELKLKEIKTMINKKNLFIMIYLIFCEFSNE